MAGGEGLAWPACPLWDDIVALYGKDGVAAACIALQDRHGLDVDFVLLACWLGVRGITPEAADWPRLAGSVERWQAEVVVPLRAARRALRRMLDDARPGEPPACRPDHAQDLRARLATIEIDLEHMEVLALARAARALPAEAAPGPALVAAHLARLGRFGAADRADLARLLAAACPDAGRGEIDLALARLTDGA